MRLARGHSEHRAPIEWNHTDSALQAFISFWAQRGLRIRPLMSSVLPFEHPTKLSPVQTEVGKRSIGKP